MTILDSPLPGKIWRYFWGASPERRGHLHLQEKDAPWAWVVAHPPEKAVFLVPDKQRLVAFERNWKTFSPQTSLHVLQELPPGEEMGRHSFWLARGEILRKWKEEGGSLLLTPGSLMGPYRLPDEYRKIRRGETSLMKDLLGWLESTGSSRVDYVMAPGEHALRGGVLDLYTSSQNLPLRVEFFDNTVESLRFFSPRDQCSLEEVEEALLAGSPLGEESSLALGTAFVFASLSEESPLVFFDPQALEKQAQTYQWLWGSFEKARRLPSLLPWEEVLVALKNSPSFYLRPQPFGGARESQIFSLPSFGGKFREAQAYVEAMKNQGYHITLCSSHQEVRSWGDARGVKIMASGITGGFRDQEARSIFLSDVEMVGISPLEGVPTLVTSPAEEEGSFAPGDYLIHEDYGIGRYCGMEEVEGDGIAQDYLVMEFAEERRLLVPFGQIYKLTPYSGYADENVTLDSLGGRRWKKSLRDARKKAREVAQALLENYVTREKVEGYGFAPSGEILKRFVATFPYTETEDQLQAVEEIWKDMERPIPMDRLLVGDVGFGKTEVAMRAAVKAVESGKQVAFLVPTTLLAQQHLESFQMRLGDLPIRVAALSRFVTPSRKKRILEELEGGNVDVLVGTHKLLSKDVAFQDLGLLIVDEEHRFGVAQKEHFRWLLPKVDILALSATPIPRTLHLSLGGLRDISEINTPPRNRTPVIHVVSPWRDDLVAKAVRQELARGGQVFFVHNRVQSIERRAAELRNLVPEATMEIAHGRLAEKVLESKMELFSSHKVDILVCTSIVESGLDIPGANTLIVDQAHTMGLAQLYQLKGRVGRRWEQAFAYFLYPGEVPLSKGALDRLDALNEYEDFGGGSRLARRDLEIRGSGELLGIAQHGHVKKVGFQMYCRFLEKEVLALGGGQEESGEFVCSLRFPLGLPSWYVPQSALRVALYRRASHIQTMKALGAFTKELRDRFGPLPVETERFIHSTALHILGPSRGVCRVYGEPSRTEVEGKNLELLFKGRKEWFLGHQGSWARGPGGEKGIRSLVGLLKEGSGKKETFPATV